MFQKCFFLVFIGLFELPVCIRHLRKLMFQTCYKTGIVSVEHWWNWRFCC